MVVIDDGSPLANIIYLFAEIEMIRTEMCSAYCIHTVNSNIITS